MSEQLDNQELTATIKKLVDTPEKAAMVITQLWNDFDLMVEVYNDEWVEEQFYNDPSFPDVVSFLALFSEPLINAVTSSEEWRAAESRLHHVASADLMKGFPDFLLGKVDIFVRCGVVSTNDAATCSLDKAYESKRLNSPDIDWNDLLAQRDAHSGTQIVIASTTGEIRDDQETSQNTLWSAKSP